MEEPKHTRQSRDIEPETTGGLAAVVLHSKLIATCLTRMDFQDCDQNMIIKLYHFDVRMVRTHILKMYTMQDRVLR